MTAERFHLGDAAQRLKSGDPRSGFACIELLGRSARRNFMEQRRKAPWPDYAGNEIHEGDTVEHPSGERGTVRFFAGGESPADQWRVDYGDLPPALRLCLQIGDKGQAVVVRPNVF